MSNFELNELIGSKHTVKNGTEILIFPVDEIDLAGVLKKCLIAKYGFSQDFSLKEMHKGLPSFVVKSYLKDSGHWNDSLYNLDAPLTPYKLTQARWKRAPADCHPYQAKTSSTYALSFLSFQEKEEGFDDVLFISTDNNICESSGSNIFFIKDRSLITPTTEMALAGITRAVIINEISLALDVDFIERNISISEISQFDAVFLCGTAMEITPVQRINNIFYQQSALISQIQEKYNESVNK